MIALYHSHPNLYEFTGNVLSCRPAGEGLFEVVLDNTAFYPTGGGQPCDAGTLAGCPVEDVTSEGDGAPVMHLVRCPAPLSGTVEGRVDARRRLDHMQQHSGQHLLSHVLYERFGAYSLGLHIGAADSYVDLVDDGTIRMTRALADELEAEVNEWIARNEEVRCLFPTPEELSALPLRKKPDAHENLRIVCIGSEEAVACCGSHVGTTGQVQALRLLSWQQSHGNLRLFFVAGLRALRYAKARIDQADQGARLFSCNVSDLTAAIERQQAANAALSHELAKARRELTLLRLSALQPEASPQGNLYVAALEDAAEAQLKEGVSSLTKRDPRAVCFLCAPVEGGFAVAMGVGKDSPLNAGEALKRILSQLGGKGGGRKDSAFGRCARMDLDQVLAALREA
jgi:alanyl-tRNA synthetase